MFNVEITVENKHTIIFSWKSLESFIYTHDILYFSCNNQLPITTLFLFKKLLFIEVNPAEKGMTVFSGRYRKESLKNCFKTCLLNIFQMLYPHIPANIVKLDGCNIIHAHLSSWKRFLKLHYSFSLKG